MTDEIARRTRQSIADLFIASGIPWAGDLPEGDFLSRLYDLSKMPSTDDRFRTAEGDIRQHRTNWTDDWPIDWVFTDSRFRLFTAPDDEFLRFLCETVHPVVRHHEAARKLVAEYNQRLAADDWKIVEVARLARKPIYGATRIRGREQVLAEPTGWQKVDRQVQGVRSSLDGANSEEDFQTVGLLCREVLISLAQEVFKPEEHPTLDGVVPSDTDADRMLQAFFSAELKGGANEEARSHAKAALKLAIALQHKRTADLRMAALCAEATYSIVNLAALLVRRQ